MEKINPLEIKKILIRGIDWIGDLVIAIPTLRAIREYFKEAFISLACSSWSQPIVYNCPYIDELITYNLWKEHKNIINRLKFLKILQEKKFDLAILLSGNFDAALMCYLAKIKYRIGYDFDHRKFLLTSFCKDNFSKPRVEKLLDIARSIGIEAKNNELELFFSEKEKKYKEEFLVKKGISQNTFLIGINFGSKMLQRQWSFKKIYNLCYKILEKYNSFILIFGGKFETNNLIYQENLAFQIINLIGQTTLSELMSLISLCKLFITTDTGPMHIAKALKVPIIGLFGPTKPEEVIILKEYDQIIYKNLRCSPCVSSKRNRCKKVKCMEAIEVEDVLSCVKKFYEKYRKDNKIL